jgi:hypothetical protein
MPLITVGVPAFNEAELLVGSLEALRKQTFQDFEVLVFDNASTDATPQIAADFAARDPRFIHIRQPYNKGEFRNFHEAVQTATSPYFLWRACDDRSSLNYLEALSALLDAHPEKDLAVGNVAREDKYGGEPKVLSWPDLQGGATFANRVRYLLGTRSGWYYGMYRREAIVKSMNEVVSTYRNLWGFDYLVLLGFMLDDKIIGTGAATFVQGRKKLLERGTPRPRRTPEDRDRLIYLRHRFLDVARAMLAERVPSRFMRALFEPVLFAFVGRKLFAFRKVALRMLTRPASAGANQQDDIAQV